MAKSPLNSLTLFNLSRATRSVVCTQIYSLSIYYIYNRYYIIFYYTLWPPWSKMAIPNKLYHYLRYIVYFNSLCYNWKRFDFHSHENLSFNIYNLKHCYIRINLYLQLKLLYLDMWNIIKIFTYIFIYIHIFIIVSTTQNIF